MAEKELKKKKKLWFSIVTGKEFNQTKIGETMASEGTELVGRTVLVNLFSLISDPKKQSFSVLFKIINVEGDQAHTKLIGYYMNQAYIKRLIRKGVLKIEDAFQAKTKDNITFVIKPVFLIRGKIKRSIATRLRMTAREFFTNALATLESTEVYQNVISNKLQVELKNIFRKIYPINTSEIRILKQL